MIKLPPHWDWKKPDYSWVFERRLVLLNFLNALELPVAQRRVESKARWDTTLSVYRTRGAEGVADFIEDWGTTFDPKLVAVGLPARVPFILFPKQREFVIWVVNQWLKGEPGLAEKTRQMGFSWLIVAIGCALCVLHNDQVIGYGSRKEEYVDKLGDPKALFPKARIFLEGLPVPLRGGYVPGKTGSHMKITFPATGSVMAGEAGDNIGRGATTGLHFVDESAFLEHPELVDASLSQTTRCRIDISTPNGMGNPFAQKRFSGKIAVFTMHWRDDPRKDDAWYEKQKRELSSVVLAQEVDIDYTASVAGVIIPGKWIQAAIDAHKKLDIRITGARRASFDVADEGGDLCAAAIALGILVEDVQEWSGAGADIIKSTQHAFGLCDAHDIDELTYDADGMGAGVRAAGRVLNEGRQANRRNVINLAAFRGSAGVVKPKAQQERGRLNEDYFMNLKAQSWHWLKHLFYCTYRAVVEGAKYDVDQIISLSSEMTNLNKLVAELSQPTWEPNTAGKMVVDKTPDGTKSPNMADSVMMLYSPGRRMPMQVSSRALDAA